MDILSILTLFFSVVLSSLLVFFVKFKTGVIRLLLYFSGAFLLTVAFTQIIPEIFNHSHGSNLGYFVLIGFFIQIILEYFSGGVDHGHHHEEIEHSHNHTHFNPLGLLIGISLHAFFEGMPFSGHFHEHNHTENMLLVGIIIHKIPIAIVLMSLFLGAGYSKTKSFLLLFLFALAAPLGSVVSFLGGLHIENMESYYQIIMALVVGIFFHIATVILYEGEKGHKFNLRKFLIIIVGVGAAILVNQFH